MLWTLREITYIMYLGHHLAHTSTLLERKPQGP